MPNRIPVLLSVFRLDLNKPEFESRAPHDNDIISVEAIAFTQAAQKLIEGEIYLSSPMAIISRLLLKRFCHTSNGDKQF